MILLAISVAWVGAFTAISYRAKWAGLYLVGMVIPSYVALIHLIVTGIAVFVTKGGQIDGPLYSSDCIWFNILMAAVQGGLGLILGLRAYSLDKTRKKAPRG